MARSCAAKILHIFKQDSNGVLRSLPPEDGLLLMFFAHQNGGEKKISLDQRVHTKCQEVGEFP